jgi:hypothetical protein
MSLPTINDYVNPDLSGIVNGQPNDATDVTNIFTSSNQVNDILDALSNNQKAVVTSTGTLTQNEDVEQYYDATSGAFTRTLPAISGQFKPITLTKIDNTLTPITIDCAGSDVIQIPWGYAVTPTATSLDLNVPGESITIAPRSGNVWEVVDYNVDTSQVYAEAWRASAQAITGGFVQVQFNNETDPYNLFDATTNYRFTAPFPGYYQIQSNIAYSTGTSSDMTMGIFKNGTAAGNEIRRGGGRITSSASADCSAVEPSNLATSSTDYYLTQAFSNGASRNLIGAKATCYFYARLVRKYTP